MAIKKVKVKDKQNNTYYPKTTADMVEETDTKKFVSPSEKTSWNADKVYSYNSLPVETINNPAFLENYEISLSTENINLIGLPSGWYHLKFFRHHHGNGFGTQIAFPYGVNKIYIRSSTGTAWTQWVDVNESKLDKTGDIKDTTITFSDCLERENINSGVNVATLFGKIQKWYNDLNPVVFTGTYSLEDNIALGQNVLSNNFTGHGNTAFGAGALSENSTGNENVAMGAYCLTSNTIGDCNTALGTEALCNNLSGGGNTALGYYSLRENSKGCGNTALGSTALFNNLNGNYNIALGNESMYYITDAYNNIAIGYEAMNYDTSGQSLKSCSNSTAIGCNAKISGNNQIQLGSTGQTVYGSSTYNIRSDARDKADIQDLTYNAYEFISKLKPRNFRWDKRDFYEKDDTLSVEEYERLDKDTKKKCTKIILNEDEFNSLEEKEVFKGILMLNKEVKEKFTKENSDSPNYIAYQHHYQYKSDGSKKGKRFHNGFIAQEVKQVMDEMGFDFAGFQDHSVNGGCDVYTLGYEQFIAPMVSTIQTMMKKIEVLEQKLNSK